ncbi:MAG: hemerythrin domain-containing protein [Desulfarculaceae bacterium]|nr:hemerythrin domain-containing protein [Desulfarculaceae bacterium]
MDPIGELKNEHRGVETMLGILENVAARYAQDLNVEAKDLDAMLEFLNVFVDQCHHGKEEEFLFPALEAAGVPKDQGPIGEMLQEHQQGRRLVAKLREASEKLASGDSSAGKTIAKTVPDYVDLLNRHIEKEESILFQMADNMLDSEKKHELWEAFEELEKERIGPGRHEAFHQLLDRLQQTYGG